jgi:hypothetical protein
MKREHFDHVLRAAAAIVEDELIIVGSQAILAQYPSPPAEMVVSEELDIYPRSDPSRSIEIDAALGQGSLFEETFGYRAHGVGPETAVLPAGWEERLVRVEVETARGTPAVGWAVEAHDLVLSKLAAGREEDYTFSVAAIKSGIVDQDELRRRAVLLIDDQREPVLKRIAGCEARAGS